MTKDRPRPWTVLDVAFLEQDTIRDLGDTFQAAGPLAIVALILAANAAIPSKTSDFDVVEGRYSALGRSVCVEADTARAIIDMAAEVGLVEVVHSDATQFAVRLLKWGKWHPKDPGAASRQRHSRGKRTAPPAP